MTAASSRWQRFLASDLWYSFTHTPVAWVASLMLLACVVCAVFAPWVAPHNPLDLASLSLMDATLPPAWAAEGSSKYLLGTDGYGRDILSACSTARASRSSSASPRCCCRC